MADSSPLIEQYRRIKKNYRDDVLFFRLGDFYEMFSEDALEVSSLLNLTLTSRNGLPMCGIPYHAARSYIGRLLRLGKKIAICEQVSEPGKGKGLVEREVVEVITPGTIVDEEYLDKGSSNYLAALASGPKALSFAHIDLSTGDFRTTLFPLEDALERLKRELERVQPREMIVQESLLEEWKELARSVLDRSNLVVNRWADWLFDGQRSAERLQRQFGTANLKAFGLGDDPQALLAPGALLDYLDETAKSVLPHVRSIVLYGDDDYVEIDESSQRNLELIRNLRDGDTKYSLLEVMDESRTAMGRRLLKWRILHPLRQIPLIERRLQRVDLLYHDQGHLTALREILGQAPDLERLCSRVAMDRAHGKDMKAVASALLLYEKIEALSVAIGLSGTEEGQDDDAPGPPTRETLEKLRNLRKLLDDALVDEPSILLTEGNLIKKGFNAELDDLLTLRDNGRQLLEAYLEEERALTGINSLKIRYNRLIGYFFEVTKSNLSLVPSHFIRRQGVVGGERFTTDRLAALESDINGASDRVIELERRLFVQIRDSAKECLSEMMAAARRIADLDVAQSLARAATVRGWVRPRLDDSSSLVIVEGRHPVVEAHLARGEFVPNDVVLNSQGVYFALITGPNMAGKSTYLRQAALIALMAQMGSFVPAREATVGMVDRVFCRVGASDNLARGESTFLVEMSETAHILHAATDKSLVIMDEVGRGTGTNDGLSLAWAICEELLNRIRCRTLFATHYHELSKLEHHALANRSMEVLERDGEIVFLRKLKEGATAESYGLHVAQLAGVPSSIIQRAANIMEKLRENEKKLTGLPVTPGAGEEISLSQEIRPNLPREDRRAAKIVEELLGLDVNLLTPLEALTKIHRWKETLSKLDVSHRSSAGGTKKAEQDKNPSLFD